jgi:RHS repeat-associated protein
VVLERKHAIGGNLVKSATLTYDANGNRIEQVITDAVAGASDPGQDAHSPNDLTPGTTTYTWDSQNRLTGVTMPSGSEHAYTYDYRTRRLSTRSGGILPPNAPASQTTISFSGGLSIAEWESTGTTDPETGNPPKVAYTRGPDMGGGVGGLLHTTRRDGVSPSPTLRYNLSNGRGDMVAQSGPTAQLTWTASYEAHGRRTTETGTNADKQRGNSKDEDPTGLLNEGFRYRDLETGVWLSRDPVGFVDGPNVYAYVKQNPWTGFDPDGLETRNPWGSNTRAPTLFDAIAPATSSLFSRGGSSPWGGSDGAIWRSESFTQPMGRLVGAGGSAQVVVPSAVGFGALAIAEVGMVAFAKEVGSEIADQTVESMAGLPVPATSVAGFISDGLRKLGKEGAQVATETAKDLAQRDTKEIATNTVTNPVPNTMARVVPDTPITRASGTLGRPGADDVFVTAADDIRGLNAQQIAERLTIPQSPTGFRVSTFPTPNSGVASPVLRPDPGFIGGGRTAGGAREFVIPNGPIPSGANTTTVGP